MVIHQKICGLVCVLLGSMGCAGTRYDVTADTAKYPLSFSRALPDEQGVPLFFGQLLEPVGTLKIETTKLGFFYSALGTSLDISNDVNEQVKAKGGEGVVGLRIELTECFLNYAFILIALPVWPGCQHVKVIGHVVRVRRGPRAMMPQMPLSGLVPKPRRMPQEFASVYSGETKRGGDR